MYIIAAGATAIYMVVVVQMGAIIHSFFASALGLLRKMRKLSRMYPLRTTAIITERP
jgi:hypothetical protein